MEQTSLSGTSTGERRILDAVTGMERRMRIRHAIEQLMESRRELMVAYCELAGYEDYRFHWNAFLIGTVGITAVSLLAGLAALLL